MESDDYGFARRWPKGSEITLHGEPAAGFTDPDPIVTVIIHGKRVTIRWGGGIDVEPCESSEA